MKTRLQLCLTMLMMCAFAQLSSAQPSNVDATNKFAWTENVGWLNFRDAGSPIASQGARVQARFLSGFVWSENTGYINLGDGTPNNDTAYSNSSGLDFGINRDPVTGNLSGFAWSENVGWVNFSAGALATPPSVARFDANTDRFFGFAWGENIGWINLNSAINGQFVQAQIQCGLADVGQQGGTIGPDGALDNNDFAVFISLFFAADPLADVGVQGGVPGSDNQWNNNDFTAFITLFFAGCI